MYKVLLADDEVWVVESLKTIIDWEAAGFRVIGQAYSGTEALDHILKDAPDIVFTDIRMPDMNGLELMKKVNDLGLDVIFIVASGYAEFAYAHKAMNYGAAGYCLKPFDEMEIMSCLKKAASILGKRSANPGTELLELIEESGEDDDARLTEFLAGLGFDNAGEKLVVSASLGKGRIEHWENAICQTLGIGASKKVYIIQASYSDVKRYYIENKLPENVQSIGISNAADRPGKLKNAISEAICSAYGYFVAGEPGVYKNKDQAYTELNEHLRQLKAAASGKDAAQAAKVLEDLRQLFAQKEYGIKAAYQVYVMAVSFIFEYVADENNVYVEDYQQLADTFDSINDMFDFLERLVSEHMEAKTGHFPNEARNETARELIAFVNSNFSSEITLQNLSAKFFINPNYISRLFKKETGLSFIEYLTRLRVDYASRLLKETGLPVQQISEKTGYNDYFYFTRIFKKMTGKTPSRFRND